MAENLEDRVRVSGLQGGFQGRDLGLLSSQKQFDKTYLENRLPEIYSRLNPGLHQSIASYRLQSISELNTENEPLSISLGNEGFIYGDQFYNPQNEPPMDMVVVGKMRGPAEIETPLNSVNLLNYLVQVPDENLRQPAKLHLKDIAKKQAEQERYAARRRGIRGFFRRKFGI